MAYTYHYDDFQEVWRLGAEVCIDTNGFLNTYRFTPSVTDEILNVLDQISERIWIPAQVIEEFNENHSKVVSRERNKYREVNQEIQRITDKAKNDFEKQFFKFGKFRFPQVKELRNFIEASITSIQNKSIEYESQITEVIEKNKKMLKEDKVKAFVTKLISSGQVGTPFTISKLLATYAEGEERYKYQIPPGYKDVDKDKTDPTKRKKFGDLILWKQLLEHASTTNKPIILITMDEKEDWWELDEKNHNVPLRPRDELLSEFKECCNQNLAMMSLTQFVNHVSKMNDITIANRTKLELNANEFAKDLINAADWSLVLGDSDLESYLINSGDLQQFLDNPLQDVEVFDFSSPNININSVEIDEENCVIFEGVFVSEVAANIDEAMSKEYTFSSEAPITIEGSINLEFTVDFSKEEEFIDENSIEVAVGGFEILSVGRHPEEYFEEDIDRCTDCGKNVGIYYNQAGDAICEQCSINYETCPDCGKLFEIGTMGGAFCTKCEVGK
ncbi:PIN domain-containing protein [Priestia sp. BR_2]